MKVIEFLFKNIEKVFRYLVPAFVFIISLKYFEPKKLKISPSEFAIFFPLIGITIYSIYRTILEIIDFIIIKFAYKISVTEAIARTIKIVDKGRDYFYYKTAVIHSTLLTSLIIILFSIHYGIVKHACLFVINVLVLIASFIVYCGYHVIQRDIPEELEKIKDANDNEQPKSATPEPVV